MKRPGWSHNSRITFLVLLCLGFVLLVTKADEYQRSVRRTREVASNRDLTRIRDAIESYTSDKLCPPQSLRDLVNEHYLREIPIDSLTGQRDWVPHFGNVKVGPERTLYGIDDVHSSTTKINSEHTPNNER